MPITISWSHEARPNRQVLATGAATDPVVDLAEYADCRSLDLVAYHDAYRQLTALLGTQFAEGHFAASVLARLKRENNNVARAVGDAQTAVLEA